MSEKNPSIPIEAASAVFYARFFLLSITEGYGRSVISCWLRFREVPCLPALGVFGSARRETRNDMIILQIK
ncbi:hypothetical protein [Serratia marcescens]|uniref:hypothetical protein n=1 Tax=Serratia marcescens TaxID=615 RepID=UPI0013DCC4A5|nr:hypothetical protein [Serratia marcescens]